ncbi:MAG: hypothetical protein JRI68_04425 [Deltaproteobacteria bacterium]|nr:hypothetical protein [Deltaproteobacteria bacterium]
MSRILLAIVTLGLLATVSGCDSNSAAHKFCMGDDGTSQDCKICCDVDKAQECCDKAKTLKAEAEKK